MRLFGTILVLISIFLPLLSSHAQEPTELKRDILEEKKRLRGVLEQIEETKSQIDKAGLKEKRLLGELGNIEVLIERREKAVARLNSQLNGLKKTIAEETRRIQELRKDTKDKERLLKKRSVAMYKSGGVGPMQALFSSDSYMDLQKRYRFMQLILKNDISTITGYENNIKALDASLKALEKNRGDMEQLKRDLTASKRASQDEKRKKKIFLASIAKSKSLQLEALKEMEESSVMIGRMISKLESSLVSDSGYGDEGRFSDFKGILDFPSEGDVIALFGKRKDPAFKTTIFQKGIEIAVPKGREIRAIFSGKVLYSDWFKGYGKIIIVDHGEGYYSLSAHASELLKEVGAEVKRGNVLALAGDTGSLKGPYLYFEIRHKGKPVDPLEWLRLPRKKLN